MSYSSKFANYPPKKQKDHLTTLLSMNAGNGDSTAIYSNLPANTNVIWHESAEAILKAYYTGIALQNDMTLEQLLKDNVITVGRDGAENTVATNYDNELKGIQNQDCWGYCVWATPPHFNENQLHFYVGPKADPDMVMMMIASELSRLTPDRHSDGALEELRISQISTIALNAMKIFNGINKIS